MKFCTNFYDNLVSQRHEKWTSSKIGPYSIGKYWISCTFPDTLVFTTMSQEPSNRLNLPWYLHKCYEYLELKVIN